MIGIVLLSHGNMAEGMAETCTLFFGSHIDGLTSCCLQEGISPEQFDRQIDEAIGRVDDGHGVILMCDMFGGTPANRAMKKAADRVAVVTGMNLPMLLELLGKRLAAEDLSDIDISALLDTSRTGIKWINELMKAHKA